MIKRDGFYEVDLNDEILMNQLIRNGIDYAQFLNWYNKLNFEEQSVLVSALFEFAYQSGINESIINDAFEKSGVLKSEHLIPVVLDFGADIDAIEEWYIQLSPDERSVVFKYSVFLFGIAENNVYLNKCSKDENCNHWWHRDLLDDKVVNSILTNPEYFLTSRKDDLEIKGEV